MGNTGQTPQVEALPGMTPLGIMPQHLNMTEALFNHMQPKDDVTYGIHSMVSHRDDKGFHWANPDEQYTMCWDKNKKQITGMFYDWVEKENGDGDWVDTRPMTQEELFEVIARDKLVIAWIGK